MSACAIMCGSGAVLTAIVTVVAWPGLVRIRRAMRDLRESAPTEKPAPGTPPKPRRMSL